MWVFKKVKGKTIITGFHGIGMVGFIAVDYLIKQLKAKRIGWIHRDYMPPVVFAGDNGLEMPVELYEYKNIIFMRVNLLMERESITEFLNEVFGKLKKSKPKEIWVVGGLATHDKNLYGVVNSPAKKRMKKLGLEKFPKEITVFGPMASALIHGEKMGIPIVCILPNASPNLPDPEAASRAITKIAGEFKLRIDVSDLEKEAKKIEDRMKEMNTKDEMTERMFV